MNFIDWILNSLVGLWRFTETLAKVEKNKADIQEMDGRIGARLDNLYKETDGFIPASAGNTSAAWSSIHAPPGGRDSTGRRTAPRIW